MSFMEYKTLFIPKSEVDSPENRAHLDALCALSQEWADEGCCAFTSMNYT